MAERYTKRTWARADNADVMLTRAYSAGVPRKSLVRAAVACARLALPMLVRPAAARRAVEVAAAFTRDEATAQEVWVAGDEAGMGDVHFNTPAMYFVARAAARIGDMIVRRKERDTTAAAVAAAVESAATERADDVPEALIDDLGFAARREANRRMAALIRASIPWEMLATAYARED